MSNYLLFDNNITPDFSKLFGNSEHLVVYNRCVNCCQCGVHLGKAANPPVCLKRRINIQF